MNTDPQTEADADTVASRAAQVITRMGADIRALTGERDRYRGAWRSARERAQAYGEGILRVVKDREQYQEWLRQAEERAAAPVAAPPTGQADAVLVAEARRAVHEVLVTLPAWEADRVRALIAELEAAVARSATEFSLRGTAAIRAAAFREAVAEMKRDALGVIPRLLRMADEAESGCDHDSQVIDHEGAQYWACLKCGMNLGRVEALPATEEPHRLALSTALGLGTSAPWDAIRERAAELAQEVRRLGLMVDEYGAGASALTDKLKRARDMHRETCILATGKVQPTAFTCGLCEVLDAPAAETPGPEAQGEAPVRVEHLARLLCDADNALTDGPSWARISQTPGLGRDEYRNAARYLLRKVTVTQADSGPAECGDQIPGMTCTLPDGPHDDWLHRDEVGHWWSQMRVPPYSNRDRLAAEATPPAVVAGPGKENGPRAICVCSHARAVHVTVSGRLLCDECDPDSTDNLVCKGFDAL